MAFSSSLFSSVSFSLFLLLSLHIKGINGLVCFPPRSKMRGLASLLGVCLSSKYESVPSSQLA